jgi:dTDP-4-amino-4,6-dideoxygalactose transaminase
LDVADAERRMTAQTRAIMPVHYASNPGRLDGVYELAQRSNLRVIEDAAHSFGGTYGGRPIGASGDVVCFSFDGIKNITSGEGGAVVTADLVAMEQVRDARLLGVERDSDKRASGMRSWDFDVTRQGYRYHMSNVFAAIGRVQLQRLKGELAPARRRLARQYRERLQDVPHVTLIALDLDASIPHIQVILVAADRRADVQEALRSEGIETGFHYKPNHLLSYYGSGRIQLPVTEEISTQLLSLPLHPALGAADVDHVCNIIDDTMRQ